MSVPRHELSHPFRAARVKMVGRNAYPLHDHAFGEIFWLDAGQGLHRVNGRDFPLCEGELVFIRPFDQHSFHGVAEAPFYISNTCFQWSLLEYLRRRHFPDDPSVFGENQPWPKTVVVSEQQLPVLRRLFLQLVRAPAHPIYIEHFLLSLFTEFCPFKETGTLKIPLLPDWMQRAARLIQQPEHFRLGVPEFSRLCGRSREHVSREFHRHAGQTLVQYIHSLRMRHAAALLEGSANQIIDIAMECGYESLSHFYACFRKSQGVSPLRYRRRAQARMYFS